MKTVISSLLLAATAVASASNCDIDVLTAISHSADASTCQTASNFEVPVETTVNMILTDFDSFCGNDACLRVLDNLREIGECAVDDLGLHQNVVNPIAAVCSTTRALRAADGSHVHSSGMDMGSASAEAEDSHEATSASTASSGAEDSHDATSSTYSSGEAGDEDSHDHASSSTSSSAGATTTTSGSKATGSSNGSQATSSNSTASTQAPSTATTSSATTSTIAAGSLFLAAAAAFF